MPAVLAIVSQKGGVGKTTTALNVAAALALRGVKTLLIDADPQGAVRFGLGLTGPEHRLGLSDHVESGAEIGQVVRGTAIPWLRAILSGGVTERDTHDAYQHVLAKSPRLPELLSRAKASGYAVVVDTPPGLGPIAERVLTSADRVLVPLQCEPLALQTSAQVLRGIRAATERNPGLALEGILLTMLDEGNALSGRVAAAVRERLPDGLVLDVAVPRTAATAEAFAAGQPLVLRAPDDAAARAYAAIAERLSERMR